MASRVHVAAPAKVNLYLGVGGVRADGYHSVDSVVHALELADDVTIELADRLSLSCPTDVGVPAEENLAWRAAVALGGALGREPRCSITVTKCVPHGAGLGGGSSDAAAVVAGLARLWGVDVLDDRCVEVAAGLGADVPFFLYGGAALMTGRGDRIVRRLPALSAPVALVRPSEPVSTAAAYRAFDADPPHTRGAELTVAALEAGDVGALASSLANNMEAASLAVVPEVGRALAWTRARKGVLGAEVAGSGSAVFALTDTVARAAEIASAASAQGWWGVSTRLRASGVEVTGEDRA